MKKNTLVVISGPTASGKSKLALNMAKNWSCPIISADSRQVFKKVDIGTAKPDRDELDSVKHYFIDHLEITDSYTVGQYEREALEILSLLFEKHEKLLLCGGTGLYLSAVCSGLHPSPPSSPASKLWSEQIKKEKGLAGLQELLMSIDPVYCEKIDMNNERRLRRALEVYHTSGKTLSSFQEAERGSRNFNIKELCLMPQRNTLYANINKRVDEMMTMGLLEETESLKAFRSCQALDTVGYKELYEYMDGKFSLDQAIELIKQHTRNFAKRQITWFRKKSPEYFIDPQDTNSIQKFIESI